jgi:hypothetical protein
MPLPVLSKVVPFQKASEVVAFENFAAELTLLFEGIKMFERVPVTLKPVSDAFEAHGPWTRGVIGFPEAVVADDKLRRLSRCMTSPRLH